MNAQIKVRLNGAGQKDALQKGFAGRRVCSFSAEISAENLSYFCVGEDGEIFLHLDWSQEIFSQTKDERIERSWDTPAFSEVPTVEGVLAFLENQKLLKKIYQENEEKEKQEKERKENEEKEKNRKEKEEKEIWIYAFGSPRLQAGYAAGYPCTKKYIIERVQKEFGDDAHVDCGNISEWKSRSCPTLEALQLERELKGQGHSARIVWGVVDKRNWEETRGEMVVVEDFLGYSYDVIVKKFTKK